MVKWANVKDFFTHGVWQQPEGKHDWWPVRLARVSIFTMRSSMRHGTAIRSAALAFFTVMSLVPILAIAFAVAKGFGMENYLTQLLYEQLPDYRSVIDILMGFVNNLLGRTRGGVMAIGAFMVLIWAVIQVFGNVEKAFNNIWEVKNTRSMARRFGVYLGVVIMVPLLLVASYTIMIGVRSRLGVFNDNMAVGILFELLSLTAVVSVFTLIYDVIPNTKVRFSNALIAGTVTGVIFYLFQILYFFIQRELGSYNAIYGAFAAIPLFLLWMQINWQIVLFGGELSFGLQNVSSYEQELLSLSVSYDYRCKIMLASMVIILRDYLDDKPSLASSGTIAHELQLPIRIIRDVMHELEKDGLVFFVENEKDEKVNNYVPAVDPRSLRLIDVVSRVTASGIELKKGKTEAPLMEKVGRIYDKVKHDFTQLPENVYLTDLIEGVDGRDADGGRNAVGGRDADTGLNVDSGRNAGGEINSEKNA